MILYKYYNRKIGVAALSKKTVRFSRASTFNDPFELVTANIYGRAPLYQGAVDEVSRIFCLARNPLNSLMWSHYGDSHRGIVIGYDVKLAKLAECSEYIIPVQYGSVVYTKTKPSDCFFEDGVKRIFESDCGFDVNNIGSLQKAFLYKNQVW
ncbi:DUF2971 domain-containing protein [Vogesella sp. LYT5W]|uniref:DUF2971 domain-containing protein n=1 Tax=Vogesella margarita TaxID=2984199 RepID=A0ABT5IQA0_9NEIS|nr:DUF2971 domain-containing protein [Vogesella margarita]MDC7714749.1 DUF2971 domain-containing protein [Vogesella margarita]